MINTGEALYTIRQKRLFREDYATFEEYVRKRWKVPVEFAEIAIEFYLSSRN